MTVGCTDTIRAGIATTDHDNMFAFDVDRVPAVSGNLFILRDQEFECEMHSPQFTSWNWQIARVLRTTREHNCIKFL